jgi:hypothetical protein
MNTPRPPEEQPWEPNLDTLPLFNPFRNPVEHLEAPRTTPIGEDVDEEIEFDPDENP